MADMQEKLSEMLSDPEAMKKVLDLASSLAGNKNTSPSQAAAEVAPVPSPEPSSGSLPDLGALFSLLGGGAASPPPPAAETAAPATAEAGGGVLGSLMDKVNLSSLPKLMDALSGKPNYLKPEKVNLLKALKPYLNASRAPDVDRAVQMANLAKAAQDTLGGIIRR